MENESHSKEGTKICLQILPRSLTNPFYVYGGEPQGPSKKQQLEALLVAIHHSGNREFDPAKLTGYLDKIHHALEAENRIYHPKYPNAKFKLLFMQKSGSMTHNQDKNN